MASGVHRTIFVSRDGLKLVADRGGPLDSPAVILLHGGGQTRHSWSRAVDRLIVEGFQVINFDARGHGESDWSPTAAYGLSDRAADLAAITAELTTPFLFVGASLGGATATVAIADGQRPAGLVLVDIVPEPEKQGVDRIVAFMRGNPEGFESVEAAALAVAAYNPARKRPADGRGLMKNLREGGDGRFRWHWDPRIVEDQPDLHHAAVKRAAARLENLPDLPVLLVRGLASDVVSDAGIAAFRRQLPRLEVLDVAGAGHMVAGDRNDDFNDGIVAFSRRVFAEAFPIEI